MTNGKGNEVQVLLAEFSALRAEILQDLSTQWVIFVFQLTAASIVFSFSLTSGSRTGFLLIIPVISYMLASRFMQNSHSIHELGTYIMTELNPRVPGGLKWEEWHRNRRAYRNPFTISWLAPLPVVFPGVSLLALAWVVPYILEARNISIADRCFLWLVWVFDFLMTIMSVYYFRTTRRLHRRS